MSRSPSGLAFALGAASLYGLNIGYARLASFAGVSGPTVVVYRVFVMLLVVAAGVIVLRSSLKVPREEWRVMGLLGVVTTLVGVLYISSVAFIPVAVAVVLFYTYPVVIVLAAPFVDRAPVSLPLVGVVLLALAGVGLVVGPATGDLDWRGVALALGASLATATQFFAATRAPRTNVIAKTFWIHLVILPISAAIGLATGSLAPPTALALAPFAVAMTIAGYVFGFVMQFLALNRISPAVAGVAFCAEPVVAALSSTVILDEPLSALQFMGGGLVVAALVLNVVLATRPSRRVPSP